MVPFPAITGAVNKVHRILRARIHKGVPIMKSLVLLGVPVTVKNPGRVQDYFAHNSSPSYPHAAPVRSLQQIAKRV